MSGAYSLGAMGINETWPRIAAWLEEEVPETAASLRPPVDFAAVAARTEGFPEVPEQLQQLYRLFDGTDRTPAGYVYPMFRALSAGEAVTEWQMLTGLWRELAQNEEQAMLESAQDPLQMNLLLMAGEPVPEPLNPYDPLRLGREAAGTPSHDFLPEFIPFAENMSGDYLFVDTREGPAHGCIRQYWKESADSEATLWDSPGELLEALEHALRTGEALAGFRPTPRAGTLNWEP